MGFFSSRKAEPTPLAASDQETTTSLKVIRSRFYGKNKPGRERASSGPSASPSAPSSTSTTTTTLPSPLRNKLHLQSTDQSQLPTGRPASTDALTMSLAQRLNELATANADGLLDDEEYRLLRQNLFERLTGSSDSPTESPVVPISTGAANRDSFRHVSRPPSVASQRSIATAVSSLFRRATGRSTVSPATSASGSVFSLQQQMSPTTDAASVYSRPSFSSVPRSSAFPNSLSRRPSDDSLMSSSQAGSASGSVTNDLRGIVSRHHVLSSGSVHYASSISSRATTRSTKPPSSFHLRRAPRLPSSRTHEDDDDDEDHPKSTAELRAEIQSVENEGRKLLDAFNGLELSALTKPRSGGAGPLSAPPDGNPNSRRLSIYPESTSSSALGSAYTLIPERSASIRSKIGPPLVKQPVNLKRKPSMVGSIAGSFKSSTSDLRSSFLSAAPPPLHSSRSSPSLLASASSPPVPTSTAKKRPPILRHKQPTFPSPSAPLPLGPHTAPPILRPSPLSHRTNTSTDPALHALEAELADIRRRRADVSTRYERRLEFLRAKLKTAEIRERLSKK